MKRLLWLTIAVLVVVTGAAGYGTARKIRDGVIELLLPPVIPPAPKSKTAKNRRQNRTTHDYQVIVNRNLFETKSDDTKTNEPMVNIDTLEKTRLNLRLWGTSVTVGLPPSAVIEDVGKRQQDLYHVGDTVQGGAKLHLVFKDRVVLRQNGRDEVLEMADPSKQSGSKRSRRGPRRPPARTGRVQPKSRPTRKVGIPRQQITDALKDLPALMRQVKVSPHTTAGQADGLSVSHIKPGSLFFRAGLKNGDVIRSINGRQVHSISDIMNAARDADMGGPLSIELQRRRRIETIEYSIK